MRLVLLVAIFVLVGVAAFSLAISGLGAVGNFLVFAIATTGLLFVTVNLTAARTRAAPAQAPSDRSPVTEG